MKRALIVLALVGCRGEAAPEASPPPMVFGPGKLEVAGGARDVALVASGDKVRLELVESEKTSTLMTETATPGGRWFLQPDVPAPDNGVFVVETSSAGTRVWHFPWRERSLVLAQQTSAAAGEPLPAWVPRRIDAMHLGPALEANELPCTPYAETLASRADLGAGTVAMLVCAPGVAPRLVAFEAGQRRQLLELFPDSSAGLVVSPSSVHVVMRALTGPYIWKLTGGMQGATVARVNGRVPAEVVPHL